MKCGAFFRATKIAPTQIALTLSLLLLLTVGASSETLPLPARPTDAPTVAVLLNRLGSLDLPRREEEIVSQVLAGNIPDFLRKLCPIRLTNVFEGTTNIATCYVMADYLAIGSDDDYFLAPISPGAAQRLADVLNCSLPTPKLVDAIYRSAQVQLEPSAIPPSAAMTTIAVFSNHNFIVRTQRAEQLRSQPLGALVAGHKKDLVVTAKLANAPGKVAIYGWHRTNGTPIQPLYLGHASSWVDYSQCTRLVLQKMLVNGEIRNLNDVLSDPRLAGLVSNEGVVKQPSYPTPKPELSTNPLPTVSIGDQTTAGSPPQSLSDFNSSSCFGERVAWFRLEPEVRIHINAPARECFSTNKKVLLVFYALPNGNTIEQTIGKTNEPGDDWRYDIQHIGAQTRFLRELLPNYSLVVAYLENDLKSWPAWRKKYGSDAIPKMLTRIKTLFEPYPLELVLSGHSGGGSWIFGYINSVQNIPNEIVRITFLDSNYAYDPALGHKDKLWKWIQASDAHYLCVLAYNDAVALLDGKTFVSAAGGTWGRTHAMLKDFGPNMEFVSRTNADLLTECSALDGRVQFLLKDNPEKKILHTVQVERNGFIHCLVSGTTNEAKRYEYFGARAYTNWIR